MIELIILFVFVLFDTSSLSELDSIVKSSISISKLLDTLYTSTS